ncbi:MAG: sugar ABC transporter substrate-binding protein [Christensenella sp.]|uniref:sugar ABC transporter substrate-binding protein n=1 Tax=Christensenella sp. TaxID=1935934 RepID=UPI002B20E193|nr:sugar ABC transporter substrate-binding protein [Christensenella sp.]MEA5003429.1 sugar ABC transporter substrate-binding protein [Christensenella sp.]
MKKTPLIAVLLICIMLFSACASGGGTTPSATTDAPASQSAATDAPASEAGEAKVHTNADAFEYVNEAGTKSDINQYYNDLGIECSVDIRSAGGDVKIKDGAVAQMPTPDEKYTIGFSVYYTIDEVGSMYLEAMKAAAAEAGIELLINDADYDQNSQNQAIEQWILQGVDGVILTPCDFTGVKASLDALEKAGIPVISLDAPPQAGNVDAIVTYDCIEQGRLAGELLEKALVDSGSDMKGKVIYNTLPFVHPNAVTRIIGFKSVFEKYPDIELIELTGESPEDHYTAFEGAIQANPEMLGAWGLYSSATIGMNNAKLAGKMEDILLTSVDNDRPILAGISKDEILGSACYSAVDGSRIALSHMINLLNGAEIPGITYQENIVVTKDNVEEMFGHYYPGNTLQDYLNAN